MTVDEVMNTRYGEMLDMITCLSIHEGRAMPKKEHRLMSFREARRYK